MYICSASCHTGAFSQIHFLEVVCVFWEMAAGKSSKCLSPCGRGTVSCLFIYLINLQPDGGIGNTEVPVTTPVWYYCTDLISLCLEMLEEFVFNKPTAPPPPTQKKKAPPLLSC